MKLCIYRLFIPTKFSSSKFIILLIVLNVVYMKISHHCVHKLLHIYVIYNHSFKGVWIKHITAVCYYRVTQLNTDTLHSYILSLFKYIYIYMNCVAGSISLENPASPLLSPTLPEETYLSSHPKNSQRQMGHSLSLGASTRHISYTFTHIYTHTYITISQLPRSLRNHELDATCVTLCRRGAALHVPRQSRSD